MDFRDCFGYRNVLEQSKVGDCEAVVARRDLSQSFVFESIIVVKDCENRLHWLMLVQMVVTVLVGCNVLPDEVIVDGVEVKRPLGG